MGTHVKIFKEYKEKCTQILMQKNLNFMLHFYIAHVFLNFFNTFCITINLYFNNISTTVSKYPHVNIHAFVSS